VVTDRTGQPLPGLQQQDFALLDNKQAQTISTFHAVAGPTADPPVEVILLVDGINSRFKGETSAREEIEKFLNQNSGKLTLPVSIFYFTDAGVNAGAPSQDAKTLIAQLKQNEVTLTNNKASQGIQGAAERLNLSLRALGQITDFEAKRPGRKLLIWLSPGWSFLSSPRVEELSSSDREKLFHSVVSVSTGLRRARITLYNINPAGTGGSPLKTYYKDFVKGVTTAKDVRVGNLGLQVLAYQSGGLVLNGSNDLAGEIATCMNDANAFYVLSFDGAAAGEPNEYHALDVKIAKPGLEARTRSGYYAQPDQAHKP